MALSEEEVPAIELDEYAMIEEVVPEVEYLEEKSP